MTATMADDKNERDPKQAAKETVNFQFYFTIEGQIFTNESLDWVRPSLHQLNSCTSGHRNFSALEKRSFRGIDSSILPACART